MFLKRDLRLRCPCPDNCGESAKSESVESVSLTKVREFDLAALNFC
jgi:hypothetical protein